MNLREKAEDIWRTVGVPCPDGSPNPYNCKGCSYELGQIEAALLSVRNETIEECAKIADNYDCYPDAVGKETIADKTARKIANDIDALRGEE